VNNPITVIIPNYNGAELLRKNLPSIKDACDYYEGQCSIIVVDDGSSDDSISVLENEFPEVNVVVHDENKGFAEAIHSGVNAAQTEFLFLLNSDVEVQPDIFPALMSYFDDTNTFSVNPLIYDEQRVVKRHSWNLRQFKGGKLKLAYWDLNSALSRVNKGERLATAYAHGGSFMVRKSMFLALNGFHPIYKPFYSEDYDLGLRAWSRGWPSYFEPRVYIVHQSLGSIRSNIKFNYVKSIRRRNRYLLEWIHLTNTQLFCVNIPFSVLQLLGELVTLDIVNLKGFGLALLKVSEVIKAREELKLDRKLTLSVILCKII
jgi:GT2 family glycosyltransferase